MCYDPNVVTHIDTLNRTVQYVFLSGMHVSNPFYANKTASMQLADGTCIAINPVLEQSDAGYSPLFSRLIMVDVTGDKYTFSIDKMVHAERQMWLERICFSFMLIQVVL